MYKLLFSMRQHHGWSIDEMERLVPFELDLYVDMLLDYLAEEKSKRNA